MFSIARKSADLAAKLKQNRLFNRNYSGSYLEIKAFGDPKLALNRVTFDDNSPLSNPKSMILELYGAPVNQADINFIQGLYPVGKVAFPKVVGFEGAFKVVEVGSEVNDFKVDDLVLIPYKFCGTWSKYLTVHQSDCFKIPNKFDPITAATIRVNPSTAYRLLSDFVKLEAGDMVAINAAGSQVGECVVQMCKLLNLKTICLIRPSVYQDNIINRLKMLGATYVITENQLIDHVASDFLATDEIGAKLGINLIGGYSFMALDSFVTAGSPIVTIGGLAKSSIKVRTSSLVFANKRLLGFKLGSWMVQNKKTGLFEQMFDQIVKLYLEGNLKAPENCKSTKLENYKAIFEEKSIDQPSKKIVFVE